MKPQRSSDSFSGARAQLGARCFCLGDMALPPAVGSHAASSSASSCTNRSVAVVAVSLARHHNERTLRVLHAYRNVTRALGLNLTVLPAVDGFNTTDVIEELLQSGVPFRNLSRGAKKWGKLAAFLSKIRALEHQVRSAVPYQLTIEDDLHLRVNALPRMIDGACAIYVRHPETTVVQLSHFTEAMLTSLNGSRLLLRLLRERGILRATDQQLLNPKTMDKSQQPAHQVRKFLEHFRWAERPWVLARAPNSADGFIWRTRKMTWAEVAMLRLLTLPGSRSMPLHGNPPLPERIRGSGQSGTWAA